MKIAVCSDLHLEFGALTLDNPGDVDVLILSGDICVAVDLNRIDYIYGSAPRRIMEHSERLENLLQSCSKNFKHTLMVMGNHEHYHGDFAKSASIIREFLASFENVHLLDKESIKIDDVTFIGGTLWTNFDLGDGPGDTSAMHTIAGLMNDYRGVKNSNRMVTRKVPVYEYNEDGSVKLNEKGYQMQIGMKVKEEIATFSPEDTYEDHKTMMQYIQSVIEGKYDEKFVVLGHHAPSKASTHPRYAHERIVS